ncbi:hypothetical protein MMC20_006318 [Loxospora ochrophaea]|nr:hypothetical protein [Loxospora ochrophaea]
MLQGSPSPRQHPAPQPAGADEILQRLFASTQREKPTAPFRSRYSNTTSVKYVGVVSIQEKKLREAINLLNRRFYREKAPLKGVWETFVELFQSRWSLSPNLVSDSERQMLLETPVFRDVLLAIVKESLRSMGISSLPSPADVIRTYLQCGVMQQWWDEVIWSLLRPCLEMSFTPNAQRLSGSTKTSIQLMSHLLEESLRVWMIFMEVHGPPSLASNEMDVLTGPPLKSELGARSHKNAAIQESVSRKTDEWPGLPKSAVLPPTRDALLPDFINRFLHFIPGKPEESDLHSTAIAALMTFLALQSSGLNSTEQCFSQASRSVNPVPFMQFVRHLLHDSTLPRKHIELFLLKRGISMKITRQILTFWDERRWENKETNVTSTEPSSNGKERDSLVSVDTSPSESSHPLQGMLKGDHRPDLNTTLKLWHGLQPKIARTPGDGDKYGPDFAKLLRTFFALGQPEKAIEVWNSLIKSGCKPAGQHWLAMLVGCKKARDLSSLQNIWQRMKAAGTQPDIQLWTTYISGLLACRQWRSAISALKELGKVWHSPNSNFQPSIVPVNAALSGLVSLNKLSTAQTVFQWALKNQNLSPNISTFNTLLKPFVRADDSSTVSQILAAMESHSCKPDIITFGILLDGHFRNPTRSFQTHTSPEAQQAAVTSIFDDMQAVGIKANAYTYSTLLDALLGRNKPNDSDTNHTSLNNLPAARAVLDHMAAHNVKPSPHIYTILITHYFASTPPNLPAIDSLWQRITLSRTPVDHVFYDRMIEGYGRVGAIEKMLFFLKRMPAEGKSPGWLALLGTLKALVLVREWELVRDLVRDVADEKEGLFRVGSRGWRGKEEFWALVEDLKDSGVEIPMRRAEGL